MGFLHDGHLSLVKESKKKCDKTFVSIFVNPAQFGPTEDFSKYPRDIERDLSMLRGEGVDYVFTPEPEDIYHKNFQTYVDVTEMTKKYEGEFRPGHFRGVTTIVSILFNIVNPDKAFFGQKDAQQSTVIKKMVKDLKYRTEIVVCPIIREPDGLAMSSRNIYLDETQRLKALILYNSLSKAKEQIHAGERDVLTIIKTINNFFLKETLVHLNYIRVVNMEDFREVETLNAGKSYFILLACKVGTTRLIDNLMIEIPL